MKGRKIAAIVLSSAIIVSGMGTVTMAEGSTKVQQEVQTVQKASDSNAEKNQDTNREEKQEVNRTRSNKEEKASPSDADVVVTNEQELKNAIGSGKSTITIEGDISLTDSLFISSGKSISLTGGKLSCGMGRPGDDKWKQMITVDGGASLKLSDVEIDATGWGNDKSVDSKEPGIRCYTIMGNSGCEIVIEDGTQIYCEPEEMKGKVVKRGIFLNGNCTMNGGMISGFTDGGITVMNNANFTMNNGEILENGNYKKIDKDKFLTAGAGIQGSGNVEVNGGIISSNEYGIWNLGKFVMNDGEISQNIYGVYNCNTSDDVQYEPDAIISGGTVENNETGITNLSGGTVTITGDATINGSFSTQKFIGYSMRRVSADTPYVIRNNDKATLIIAGGTVSAYASNEIAIFNDSTSTLKMNGGEIVAAGENSVAIQNANMKRGDVTIEGGTLTTTGTGSKLFDNQGHIDLNVAEVILGGDASGKYIILASHNEGGNVAISSETAVKDETIQIKTTPDDGYRISDVKVDNVSKGAAASLEFTVTGNHKIEVTFEKKQSSGSGSSGGSSSGSSRTSVASSTKTIPETPGSWIQDQTGWKFITGAVPYNNTWIRKNNAWYWVGEDGYMKTGWNLISEKWYYLMPVSGEMKTGWIADGENWYYTDETGARLTGWVKTGDKWYYLNADGKMAVNVTTPDGYKVDENGVMIG